MAEKHSYRKSLAISCGLVLYLLGKDWETIKQTQFCTLRRREGTSLQSSVRHIDYKRLKRLDRRRNLRALRLL